jgi:Tol biopolymer transport system component
MEASGERTQVSDGSGSVVSFAWSPDGDWLAYIETGPQTRLGFLGPDGPTTLLLDALQPAPSIGWSPDSTRVVFAASTIVGQEQALYVATAGVIGVSRLATLPALSGLAAWPPDGNEVAYIAPEVTQTASEPVDAAYNLHVMALDGSQARRLTNDSDAKGQPAWSRDGRYIAYGAAVGDQRSIQIVSADGTSRQTLVQSVQGGLPETIAWSPDGTRVAYDNSISGGGDVFVADADGKGSINLTEDQGIAHSGPSWSPDGSRISYSAVIGEGPADIFIVNSDGTGRRNITKTYDVNERSARWAPSAR